MERSAIFIMLFVVLFSRTKNPEQVDWLVSLTKIWFRENTWEGGTACGDIDTFCSEAINLKLDKDELHSNFHVV